MRLIDADNLKVLVAVEQNGNMASGKLVTALFEDIPKVEAIPIEWLDEKYKQMDKVWKTADTVDEAFHASDVLYAIELVTDLWKKEND